MAVVSQEATPILEWALLGRCECTPGVTKHLISDAAMKGMDHARITLGDSDGKWCTQLTPHTVDVYDVVPEPKVTP